MILSPCIEWIFAQEYEDFCDRIVAAKAVGCHAVEFHLWRDKPVEKIRTTLDETGIKLTSFCVEPRRALVDPAEHDEFLAAIAESLETAKFLGSPPMIIASGFARAGVPFDEHVREAVKVLTIATKMAQEAGVLLLLEPLNDKIELPNMFLSSTKVGLDIVEEVASPNLRLLYDVYHSAVMGEDIAEVLTDRIDLVGHVHFADTSGRREPGTGGIAWNHVMSTLRELGYDGVVGLEYHPTLPATESLAATRAVTGLSL